MCLSSKSNFFQYNQKGNLIERFGKEALPWFTPQMKIFTDNGLKLIESVEPPKLKLVVDSMYALEETSKAYEKMVSNLNVGKIVINVLSNAQDVCDGKGTLKSQETKEDL